MRPDPAIVELLACPKCHSRLGEFACEKCGLNFPVVNGVPVLFNEERSIFRTEDVVRANETTYRRASALKRALKGIMPSISTNINTKANFASFFKHLSGASSSPTVLVVGGAVEGKGLGLIPDNIALVETDVAIGPKTIVVCDAHDLPFPDSSFDGVIVQAVLEHVLEPGVCVSEIHRVLKEDGLVYAETPFMQQVHAGRYDFTRFTHLGHRYLFRRFREIDSGPCSGPATAFVWAYCYFLQSFFRNQTLGKAAFAFGTLTGFWLKYLDHFLVRRPTVYDAASAYYFLGSKSEDEISGIELISDYKGAIY